VIENEIVEAPEAAEVETAVEAVEETPVAEEAVVEADAAEPAAEGETEEKSE
jgi:hypothetical protein